MSRTVLITGATRGLGRAIAVAFGKSGYQVALNYAHNEANAREALAEVEQHAANGGSGAIFKADALSEAGVTQLISDVSAHFGQAPDTLVINATPPQYEKELSDYTDDDLTSMHAAFILGPHYLTKAALPSMKQNKFGRIIHITSEVFELGLPRFSAYVAAKGGQIGYMRSTANELAPHGITVNALAPGWIPVERHDDVPQETRDNYLATIPVGRWGTPQDIAHTALFFAHQDSGFVTGQSISVNGGKTNG